MRHWLAKIRNAAAAAVIIIAALGILALSPWWLLILLLAGLAAWLAGTRPGRQAWSVARVGVATIPQRLPSSSVVVFGIAGVVGVLVALLAMGVISSRRRTQAA